MKALFLALIFALIPFATLAQEQDTTQIPTNFTLPLQVSVENMEPNLWYYVEPRSILIDSNYYGWIHPYAPAVPAEYGADDRFFIKVGRFGSGVGLLYGLDLISLAEANFRFQRSTDGYEKQGLLQPISWFRYIEEQRKE